MYHQLVLMSMFFSASYEDDRLARFIIIICALSIQNSAVRCTATQDSAVSVVLTKVSGVSSDYSRVYEVLSSFGQWPP